MLISTVKILPPRINSPPEHHRIGDFSSARILICTIDPIISYTPHPQQRATFRCRGIFVSQDQEKELAVINDSMVRYVVPSSLNNNKNLFYPQNSFSTIKIRNNSKKSRKRQKPKASCPNNNNKHHMSLLLSSGKSVSQFPAPKKFGL